MIYSTDAVHNSMGVI